MSMGKNPTSPASTASALESEMARRLMKGTRQTRAKRIRNVALQTKKTLRGTDVLIFAGLTASFTRTDIAMTSLPSVRKSGILSPYRR